MYRVFEALDELVTIVEEARGVPMTSSCVVPRGDVLELLDDVRDALPAEVDDAQDVLDKRDDLIHGAYPPAFGLGTASPAPDAESVRPEPFAVFHNPVRRYTTTSASMRALSA